MKILVLSSHTPSLFWFRLDMMRAFIEAGAEVIAVGPDPENLWKEKFSANSIAYRCIPVSRNGLDIITDLKTFKALYVLISEIRPDKIFTYQAKTIVYGTLAARCVSDCIDVYPLVAGLGSIFRGKGLKNRLIRFILGAQYRLAFRYARKVIFQNTDDRCELVTCGILNESRTAIVHGSGVNVARFTVAPVPSQKAVLYVGRLIADKGVREYLDMCVRLKKRDNAVRCLLVGPFDTNPSAITPKELKPYIDAGVEYFGEQKDVRPYMSMCTVYVLPSYHEGTPKTVLEAMATGRPIVTTDAPGCRETVTDGVNGRLVAVRDVDALVRAVSEILYNPDIAASYGRESRRLAEEKFDVVKVNKDIMKIMRI